MYSKEDTKKVSSKITALMKNEETRNIWLYIERQIKLNITNHPIAKATHHIFSKPRDRKIATIREKTNSKTSPAPNPLPNIIPPQPILVLSSSYLTGTKIAHPFLQYTY